MDSMLCQGTLVQIAASVKSFTVSCSLMEFNKYSLAECSVIDSAPFIFCQPCRMPQPLQKICQICQRLTVRSFGDSLGEGRETVSLITMYNIHCQEGEKAIWFFG